MKRLIKILAAIAIILLLGFVIVQVVKHSKASKKDGNETNVSAFSEELGVLPTISAVCDGAQVNSLHGYTTAMDTTKMHDNLIAVSSDERNFKIKIDKKDTQVGNIRVSIDSFDQKKNILNQSISDYEENDDEVSFDVEVPKEAGEDKEWMLTITLTTSDYKNVNYYSRVEALSECFVGEQVEFANFFSETTLDYEKAASWSDGIIGYIEPDDSDDNKNLGHVTIHSSFLQLTWGNMEVTRISDPVVTLKEMDKRVGAYELTYMVKSVNEYDQEEYYNVTEFFRIWSFAGYKYLRSYDRKMNQVFQASGSTITANRINLGIQETLDFDYVQSENNRYMAYVIGDSLWCVDTDDYKAVNVYSIGRNAKDNIKDSEIQCMSVDNDGNVEFIVYGYINSLAHAGKNGVVAYSYTESNGYLRERLFVEYDKPYDVLRNEVGKLYHIADGVLYIYIDSCINYVNLTTKEHGQIVTNLGLDTFAVNAKMDTIAYNEGGTIGEADSIKIMNFETGEIKSIDTIGGEKIRVCGYAGNDLIYGVANEDEIKVTSKSGVLFPMKNLYILKEDLSLSREYTKENIRVTDVLISNNMITLKRTKRGKETNDDQLFETAGDANTLAQLSYIVTDLKETTPVLVFANPLDTREKLSIKGAKLFVEGKDVIEEDTTKKPQGGSEDETETAQSYNNIYGGKTDLDLGIPANENEYFYVYAGGDLVGVYAAEKPAIDMAESKEGVVTGEHGEKIYAFEEEFQN